MYVPKQRIRFEAISPRAKVINHLLYFEIVQDGKRYRASYQIQEVDRLLYERALR
jgi:hypothetical protein